jgi:guanosine-3',5'-bis(diphosphate) 3'-pyrophosphohydrolase
MRPGSVMEVEPEFLTGPGIAREAFEFAAAAHDGQERKGDGQPYIRHPVEVARLLHREGVADEELLAASFLHDVVEDTEIELDEIDERFGPGIGGLVTAMTEDKEIEPYEVRKDRHRDQVEAAGERAAMIYVADKLANLRDLRTLYASVGEAAAARFKSPLDVRVRLWQDDLRMGRRVVPELGIVAELEGELDAFAAERASTT